MTTICTGRSISKVAIYTLAVLAAQDLDREANATPSIKSTQPETSNFLTLNNATTPVLTRPVAPPEIETHTAPDRALAAPTQIFTPYLDRIRASLPPGWLMRLPDRIGDDRLSGGSSYVVRVSASTSQPALTVSLLTCKDLRSCLVGSFAVSSKISLAAQAEFKKHRDAATPIALAHKVSRAAELFRLSTSPGFFNNCPVQPTTSQNNTVSGYSLIGSVQVPVTYNLSPKLQVDLTPGVVYYPGTVKGAPFFGTFFNLGAGINWQTSQRLNLFANANLPLVGNNAFRSQDSSFFKRVVWTAGAR